LVLHEDYHTGRAMLAPLKAKGLYEQVKAQRRFQRVKMEQTRQPKTMIIEFSLILPLETCGIGKSRFRIGTFRWIKWLSSN
jgi:hypothetical protein